MPLDPDCLAQLKLRQQPFDDVPSEAFLYSDPLLESLIETASRALMSPGAIVVLAGASGSGRSIQLMQLLGALDDGFELIAFRGRPNIAFDVIDATIRNHLRAGGLESAQRSLADLLAALAHPVVLAIDDAHLIGGESIRQLLRIRGQILESGGQGLRLILIGDPSFSRASLPLPDPFDDAQVVRLNLRPFNLEQAGAYLRHRLRIAGIDDPEAFLTSGDIAVLQTNSKGLPDALNKNANVWLARRCRRVGSFAHNVAGKLVGVVGAKTSTSRVDEPPDDPLRTLVDAGVELPEGILELESKPDDDPQLARFLLGEDALQEHENFQQILARVRSHQLSQTPTPTPTPTADPPTAQVSGWNRPWLIPLILVIVVLSIGLPVGFQLIGRPSGGVPEGAIKAPRVTDTLETAQARPGLPSQAVSEPIVDRSPTEPALAQNADDMPEPSVDGPSRRATPSAPEAIIAPPKDASPMQDDLAWLTRQAPERFTIQLVAARDLETAQTFLARHDLSGIHYIKTRSYVIALLGSFPSRALASALLPELPQAVRENGPWIRTIGSVRESLP